MQGHIISSLVSQRNTIESFKTSIQADYWFSPRGQVLPPTLSYNSTLDGRCGSYARSSEILFRKDRLIPHGAYIPTTNTMAKDAAISRPVMPETKAALLGIYSPKPIRAFHTAQFMENEHIQDAKHCDWSMLLSSSSPVYDSVSYDASTVHLQQPLTSPHQHDKCHLSPTLSTASPLSMPAWPSGSFSLSIPSFDIGASNPSTTSACEQNQDLFGYLSLSVPHLRVKKRTRFDPFQDAEDPFPINDMHSASASDSTSPSLSNKTYSSPATSIGSLSFVTANENLDDGELPIFREAVRLSTRVLCLDERRESMDEEVWKNEMGKVLALWKGMFTHTKGISDRLGSNLNT